MRYEVRFVEDTELPSEVDFAFVRFADQTYLFMKRAAIDAAAGPCAALSRSFDLWQRAQCVEARELVAV